MSRMLWCKNCESQPIGNYPGEGHKKVSGLVRADCICDHCGSPIQKGDRVSAVTFFRNGRYMPWEEEYIIPDKAP